jgi:hypothetical protein
MSVLELLNIEIPGEPYQSRIRFDESYYSEISPFSLLP